MSIGKSGKIKFTRADRANAVIAASIAEKKDYIIQVKYFCRKQNAFGIIGSVEQQVNEFLATIPAEDVVDVIMDSSSGYAVYRKEKV